MGGGQPQVIATPLCRFWKTGRQRCFGLTAATRSGPIR
jgi:hypothetical protein